MRHEALPQGLTVEQLAQWLYENKVDSKTHKEEEPYTEEEIQEFEHKSSLASRSIDKLLEIEKRVKEHLKEGVFDEPITITLPPTNGIKILLANRKYADEQIELGYSYREIDLYGIPYNDTEQILFFDAEGSVWDDYSEKMSESQKHQYIGMFGKDAEDSPKVEESAKEDSGIDKDSVDTKNEEEEDNEPEKITEANASDEQDFEQDSVVVVDEINLNEEQQGSDNGAF